jgi:hypothetical protein
LADAAASPGQLHRPCLAAVGHLPAGYGSACLSGQNKEAHSTLGLCDWRVRCAALRRLRWRLSSSATTTARNAGWNLHDDSDRYQLEFKRTTGKYDRHVDRQVMAAGSEEPWHMARDWDQGELYVCCTVNLETSRRF